MTLLFVRTRRASCRPRLWINQIFVKPAGRRRRVITRPGACWQSFFAWHRTAGVRDWRWRLRCSARATYRTRRPDGHRTASNVKSHRHRHRGFAFFRSPPKSIAKAAKDRPPGIEQRCARARSPCRCQARQAVVSLLRPNTTLEMARSRPYASFATPSPRNVSSRMSRKA